MVAKIGISNNLYGVLAYNYEKVQDKETLIFATSRLGVPYNQSLSFGQYCQDLLLALPQKMRCKNPILHILLNSHFDYW